MDNEIRAEFVIQAHLTASCQENCGICYMKNASTFQSELDNEMPVDKWQQVFKDLSDFSETYEITARTYLTGGDPILYSGLFELLLYLHDIGLPVRMMGNPSTLTLETADRLAKAGVERFQLSLDSSRADLNDRLRNREGHFEDTLAAVRVLKQAGIQTSIMTTVSKKNASDLVNIAKLADDLGVTMFNFARLVPYSKDDISNMCQALEYRELLVRVDKTFKRLKKQGSQTIFGYKDNLWALLRFEQGEISDLPEDDTVYSGCPIGIVGLSVLADGTVYSCRRLPVAIGKVPEQRIEDIFFNAPFHENMRDIEKFEKCRHCELLRFCRGCPAVAYAVCGSAFAPDPQCWKVIDKDSQAKQ